MGMIFLSLNLLRDCRFHLIEYKTSSLFINQVPVVCTFMVFTINIIIGAFDSGLASIVPTSTFNAPSVPSINSNWQIMYIPIIKKKNNRCTLIRIIILCNYIILLYCICWLPDDINFKFIIIKHIHGCRGGGEYQLII